MVRMHHEKKVAERLDKMGIENFVPVQQEFINGATGVKSRGRSSSYDGICPC